MVGSTTWVLLEIYLAFQQWKNFENPLRIDKVIAMNVSFPDCTRCVYTHADFGDREVPINSRQMSLDAFKRKLKIYTFTAALVQCWADGPIPASGARVLLSATLALYTGCFKKVSP